MQTMTWSSTLFDTVKSHKLGDNPTKLQSLLNQLSTVEKERLLRTIKQPDEKNVHLLW